MSFANDDGVEMTGWRRSPGGEAQCCCMPLWKVGGVIPTRTTTSSTGITTITMMTVQGQFDNNLFFDATTNLVVGFIPFRERGVVILTTKTKTTVGWLVA